MHKPPEWMLCYWETRTRLILTALMTGLSSPRRIAHSKWEMGLYAIKSIIHRIPIVPPRVQ